MIKISHIALVSLLSALLLLSACAEEDTTTRTYVEEPEEERGFSEYDRKLHITEDSGTGCKYIVYSWSDQGGITPLLKANGTPDCPETIENNTDE